LTAEQRAAARRKALRVAALFGAAVALGLCARVGIGRLNSTAEAPAHAVLVVSRSGGPGVFPTVQEALLKARPGDHVRVADEAWEESVHLGGEGGTAWGVVLESAGERPVVWRAPRGHRDDQPLLYVSSVQGFLVRNFTLDGRDRVKDLVCLSGPCPGLSLEDLHLAGFSRSAVVLSDVAGEADRPVMLRRLRAAPARPAAAALRFEGRPEEGNRSVRVHENRFEGPYQAAATFAGPATDVEFVRNRLFNAADGLLYRRSTRRRPRGGG
jgi:hypothetical protein